MPVFKYLCVDAQGKETQGVLEGDSSNQIRQQLRQQGLIPIDIAITKEKKSRSFAGISLFKKRISTSDLSLLTYQFSTLLAAGLTIEETLLNTAEQSEKHHMKSILLGVHAKVLEGHSLAASLEQFPNSFPKLYRASVAAGEKSGQLDKVLTRLATYMEKQQDSQQKIQQALIYPSLLTLVSIGIVAFLLTYAVPRIVNVFGNTGQALPWVTQVLLDISYFTKTYGAYLLIALFVGLAIWQQLLKQRKIRAKAHKVLLKLPVLGKTIREINSARFSRTFGILFAASVPVLEAMHAANSVVKIIPMQEAIKIGINKVREGTPINRALKETGYFSLLSVRLIAAGEMSGTLESMLEKTANYQDRIVSQKIDMGLTLFEPLMILFMGLVVLFIVLAILLPIFEINQFIG